MHRGELAYIKEDYIRLPRYFLKSLNLYNGSRMTGLHYPNKYDGNQSITEDLIFSPIPFDIWPFTFRLSLKIKEGIGTINSVTNTLKDLKINILLCDCHKAGYRYNMWFLILNSVKIQEDCKSFLKDIHSKSAEEIEAYKNEVEEEMSKLRVKIEQNIKEKCEDSLFMFENEKEKHKLTDNQIKEKIKTSFTIKTGKTLPYHFWKYHIQNTCKKNKQFPPFICSINDNKIEFKKEPLNPNFLNRIGLYNNNLEPMNAFVNAFVNIHTTATRIRVAIPPLDKNYFFKKILLEYSLNKSSIGYLSILSDVLKEFNIKILNINNRTLSHSSNKESGILELIISMRDSKDVFLCSTVKSFSNEKIKFDIVEKLKYKKIIFNQLFVRDIYNFKIFISIQNKFEGRDEFLQEFKTIGYEFGLNDTNFITVDENEKNVLDTVVQSLQSCDGFVQFYIDFQNKKEFIWLEAEYLSARTIDIPSYCVIIADNNKSKPIINTSNAPFKINNKNLKDEKDKNEIKKMFKTLLNNMKKKTNSHFSNSE